ncbi:oleate hydratase [Aspergillus ibericus CBS 121593]|uniref:67 kDa myosin-cross-reactive antigen like protein n=1 Tax=Aspergillus ibericus CBS 121593 TaxID=1448316 RepID=A0A395GYZ5_9EURO|nr:67 kDa myosin-cross-reactive antigen like protein [Aspergillus ibericus CBS 121593]RAL00842.1 67 kDa myosin-cross-reactive antigen like protein [Aspergillus ibericus CBS 121593]
MNRRGSFTKRDPAATHAWLIGSGIASLSAAVHLIHDAHVPAANVHILDVHSHAGGAIKSCGNAEDGYVLYTGSLPYFHDRCVENLLSLVPDAEDSQKSLLQSIKEFDKESVPETAATTRLMKQGKDGPELAHTKSMQIGPRYRLELIKVMLENERTLGEKSIQEIFDEAFFKTNFWTLWSTTFALQPWHSAVEFRRCLCKHLADIERLNDVKALDRTKYTIYESIILPIESYLRRSGVDFHFHAKVTNLQMNAKEVQTTVSQIFLDDGGEQKAIEVRPEDIVIVTLGSTSSGSQRGSNDAPPTPPQEVKNGDWSLWIELAEKCSDFGNPLNFHRNIEQAAVENFTVTLRNSDFMQRYETLTHDKPGAGALISFADSNWGLSLSVPRQPVCSNQPPDVDVFWGYGLHPEKAGNFISKPMSACSGKEIMTEVLAHLGFPPEDILAKSITIPVLMPLATAPLLARAHNHRPEVIPFQSKNLAFVGQYVEIQDDTTLSMEYSVRGAQLAVCSLMRLPKHPPKIERHLLLNVFDLLGGA